MKKLEVRGFGPIKHADVTFGDLTVLVGQQATGKSLFTQLLKGVSDAGAIRADLKQYGYEWLKSGKIVDEYAALYFGGGLQKLLSKTSMTVDGKSVPIERLAKPGGRTRTDETVFLIPAQRVLVLQDGWPKPFMAYLSGDPYCMRRFSEVLRTLMDDFDTSVPIFPQPNRLMSTLRESIDHGIYAGFKVKLEVGQRKQLILSASDAAAGLPLNAWSAGQREFTPLLFSMYWLMPPRKTSRRAAIEHVVIEEPEMGLHPKAIVGFMLLVLSLLHRGYRVTVSTHSPVVLDVVWAIKNLAGVPKKSAMASLRDIFEVSSGPIDQTLKSSLSKDYRVHFFDRQADGVIVREISNLDPGSEDPDESGWGGLSGFSGRIAELVGVARVGANL